MTSQNRCATSRSEARMAGLGTYFTGRPCKRGHLAERLVAGDCVECHRERGERWRISGGVEYMRRYQANNRDHLREHKRIYRRENAEAISATIGKWCAANIDRVRAAKARYREANRDKIRAAERARYAAAPQVAAERTKRWGEEKPDRRRAIRLNYVARKVAAEGMHTAADIERLHIEQCGRCYYCHADLDGKYHVDHKNPLSRGGSNWPKNLCLACPTCNVAKGAKTAEEFMELI